jgi:hypothetical protein
MGENSILSGKNSSKLGKNEDPVMPGIDSSIKFDNALNSEEPGYRSKIHMFDNCSYGRPLVYGHDNALSIY